MGRDFRNGSGVGEPGWSPRGLAFGKPEGGRAAIARSPHFAPLNWARIHHCFGSDVTVACAVPRASATMRRIFASYSMSTRRRPVIAASTRTPGSA